MDDQQPATPLDYQRPETRRPRQELGILISKVAALYCFIQAVPTLGFALFVIIESIRRVNVSQSVIYLGSTAIYIGMGVALWAKSGYFGRLLLPDSESVAECPVPSTAGTELQTAAISILGLYVIALGLPRLFSALMQRFWGNPQIILEFDFRRLIEPVVTLACGLVLFLGSKGLVKIWQKLRSPDMK